VPFISFGTAIADPGAVPYKLNRDFKDYAL
jgi:hypothetical protein